MSDKSAVKRLFKWEALVENDLGEPVHYATGILAFDPDGAVGSALNLAARATKLPPAKLRVVALDRLGVFARTKD